MRNDQKKWLMGVMRHVSLDHTVCDALCLTWYKGLHGYFVMIWNLASGSGPGACLLAKLVGGMFLDLYEQCKRSLS